MEAPSFPAGPYNPESSTTTAGRDVLIGEIERAPAKLSAAVAGLSDAQLDTRYRNWTIRQIVHHLPDSHANSYIRFKWALTEDRPTIKAYNEGHWAALEDSRRGDIGPPLALFEAVHAKWVQLMRSMTEAQFERTFIHPETDETVVLSAALAYYAWHCRHHTGQILWLRQRYGWAHRLA